MNISAEMCAQVLTAAGDIARRNDKYREAERLYLDALEFVERSYGLKSYQAASLCAYLSDVTKMQGKMSASEIYIQRAEEINRLHQRAYIEPGFSDLLHSL